MISSDSDKLARTAVETAVKEEYGFVLANLISFTHDIDLAEDLLQESCVEALKHWPAKGVPDSPRAWLLTTAKHKAIDLFRRDKILSSKEEQIKELFQEQLKSREDKRIIDEQDERLNLIFTCCHPSLALPAQVALTLRTLGGLATSEIARAFIMPEATMSQRLVRAKRKIKAAGIPYAVPPVGLWKERLEAVLTVLYLIFNEGYLASEGDNLYRSALCDEAIRLQRILFELMPDEGEVIGLLALMLLHDSRREARIDEKGDFVPLEFQERTKWKRNQIDEGIALLDRAVAMRKSGPYQIQAAVSSLHAQANSYDQTDWHQIVLLYRKLYELMPSAVVKLNEIVALAMHENVELALAELQKVEDESVLANYQPFHAAKADLLRRSGRLNEAAEAYRRAMELTNNRAELIFLNRQLVKLLRKND